MACNGQRVGTQAGCWNRLTDPACTDHPIILSRIDHVMAAKKTLLAQDLKASRSRFVSKLEAC